MKVHPLHTTSKCILLLSYPLTTPHTRLSNSIYTSPCSQIRNHTSLIRDYDRYTKITNIHRWLGKFDQFYGLRVSNFSPHPLFCRSKGEEISRSCSRELNEACTLNTCWWYYEAIYRETKFRARLGKIAGKLPADVTGEGGGECYAHSRALTRHHTLFCVLCIG